MDDDGKQMAQRSRETALLLWPEPSLSTATLSCKPSECLSGAVWQMEHPLAHSVASGLSSANPMEHWQRW